MAHLLTATNIGKSFGVRPLFEELSFTVHEDERIGLIGPNGAGKSTLIRILAGLESQDSGEIVARKSLRIAYLSQTEQFRPEDTVEAILFQATDHALHEQERHYRVGEIISVFGFPDESQKSGALSGGWRKRLAIATTLLRDPDLVLLDEPTNHLDLEGIIWLEQFLQTVPFSTIIISHDRVFLENATNRTIEISKRYPKGFISVDGNYSEFLERRDQVLEQLSKQEQSLANAVRRELEWLRRMPKARTTKASARIDRAEALSSELTAAQSRSRAVSSVNIDFLGTGRQTKQFVVAEKISKQFGPKTIFRNFSFALLRGMRVGIVGANGSGKSTLMSVIAGSLELSSGTISRAPALRITTFDQQRAALDPSVSLKRYLAPEDDSVVFRDNLVHIASYARRFRFGNEQLDTPVSKLSGGEQARLLIAKLMLEPTDLLLLDEPTNDLDIDTLQVLEENLISFPGAVVLITHDRFMIESVCTHFLAIENEKIELFSTYGQWREAQELARRTEKRPKQNELAERKKGSPPRGLTSKEEKELARIENQVQKAEEQVKKLESEIALLAPSGPSPGFTEACERFAVEKKKLEALYEKWQMLESKRA